MSSMRNAVSRRNHKERSQPEARTKWGLLEKHKDYSLRAKDYNVKKQKLSILSQKSRERHPDEFAFGMLSADKGVQGKHGRGDQEKNKLSHDTVKLLKTQDSGYLRTILARGRKEIDRLGEEVAVDSMMKARSRENKTATVWNESDERPAKKRRLSVENLNRAAAENLESIDNNSATEDAEITDIMDNTEMDEDVPPVKSKKQLEREKEVSVRQKIEKRRRKLLRERRAAKLMELKKRQKEILAAADQLELQRAKMAKAIGGINKNGVKFKLRERKK